MLPTHLAVVMDGNRRFARELMKNPWIGHKYGLEKSREVLRWACEAGIPYMTAYTLSLENITSRPKEELATILQYIEEEADAILNDRTHLVHRTEIRVRFIGRTQVLPKRLQAKMARVEEMTRPYTRHVLNIAVAYGGRQELVDALKAILEKSLKGVIRPADLNEDIIKQHLYTNGQPYPDLIIRTGGEQRLSNFLTFQSAYSEFVFTAKKWPQITKRDFTKALQEFDRRKRRYGK